MAMLKARSVFNTRKKKEFYTLKKFYKANLEIQYKHNVNVNVSDAFYAHKNKEIIDVRNPIEDIIDVIDVREPIEDIIDVIGVREPIEDIRVVNDNIPVSQDENTKKIT